ncbi:hypothetical protein P3H15_51675 [Rhodococcus sp. T2V]|nr:hypothetical protein [Rhodococcus sp. T2V]
MDDAWGRGHLVERNVALNIDGNVYDPTDPMGKMFIGFLAGADHAGCRWFPRTPLPLQVAATVRYAKKQ